VVGAARLWFAPAGGELTLEIKLQPGDTRLRFSISRTEEVIHTDESTPGVASMRSGLLELYHHTRCASKLPAGEMLLAGRTCMHDRDDCLISILETATEKVGGSRTLCRQHGVTGSEKKSGMMRRVEDADGVGDDDGDTASGIEAEGRVTQKWGW
jgi:hypothetical protein